MNIVALLGAIELGFIYGLVALGVYLSFRVLNFPDLTVDGSFPLGAAMTATLIIAGINPYIATVLAIFLPIPSAGTIPCTWQLSSHGTISGSRTLACPRSSGKLPSRRPIIQEVTSCTSTWSRTRTGRPRLTCATAG